MEKTEDKVKETNWRDVLRGAYPDVLKPEYRHFDMAVRDGWEDLVTSVVELALREGCQLSQIKEKFGRLEIYTRSSTPALKKEIDRVRSKSLSQCEWCGENGSAHNMKGGWRKTMCPACAEKEGAKCLETCLDSEGEPK